MSMEIPIARPIARDGRTLRRIARDQSEVRVTRGCLVFLTVIAALTADRRQPDRDLRNRRAFFRFGTPLRRSRLYHC